MKKIIALILAVAMLLSCEFYDSSVINSLFVQEAEAASVKVWDGTADTSWYKEGETYFELSTPEQLAGLSVLCDGGNTFGGVTINLTKDIKLNKTTNFDKWTKQAPENVWFPIGGISSWVIERHFDGVFNGNGHTISGMYVNDYKPGGFFSVTQNAAVVNLKFKDCMIVPAKYACGIITGESYNSYFANCEASNIVINETTLRDNASNSVGSLVGAAPRSNGGASAFVAFMAMGLIINPLIIGAVEGESGHAGTTITDCKVNGFNLKVGMDNASTKVGGIIGNADNGVFIYNCLVMNGKVSANDTVKEGNSVCGIIHAGGKGDVQNCYYYNVTMKNADTKYGANETVKKVSKTMLTSAKLVKKLGTAYKQGEGKAPALKRIKMK